MTRIGSTLKAKLLWSHMVVVGVGVVVVVVAGRQLGDTFVNSHLQTMTPMMHGQVDGMDIEQFEDGVRSSFNRALIWAAVLSAASAVIVATFAARRLLAPIEDIRAMTHRIASGSYHERIQLPRETELAALAADVNALAASLGTTEQRRSRLIGEVAHELRTPVATLKGYLEGLLDGVFEPDEEILSAAIGEATRLERLAADLSSLSRAEEQRVDLNPAPLDVRDVIGQVGARLRSQYDDNDVDLSIAASPMLPVVADADRIAQILTNVIGNALAHTPSGGHVTVSATSRGDQIVVEVADDGRGLAAEQLEVVFERFYRADRSAPGGSGIGLTIARNLARRHGGDLTAASDGLGHGATFILTLPAESAAIRATAADHEQEG